MGSLRVKQLSARPRMRDVAPRGTHSGQGTKRADGTGHYAPNVQGKRRKAPFTPEHIEQARALGVTPKDLQRELSRCRREREAAQKLARWADSINQS